jgi:hypothetical protein
MHSILSGSSTARYRGKYPAGRFRPGVSPTRNYRRASWTYSMLASGMRPWHWNGRHSDDDTRGEFSSPCNAKRSSDPKPESRHARVFSCVPVIILRWRQLIQPSRAAGWQQPLRCRQCPLASLSASRASVPHKQPFQPNPTGQAKATAGLRTVLEKANTRSRAWDGGYAIEFAPFDTQAAAPPAPRCRLPCARSWRGLRLGRLLLGPRGLGRGSS